MKKVLLSMFALAVAASLTGCETIKGIGKDLENTGNNISEAVSRAE